MTASRWNSGGCALWMTRDLATLLHSTVMATTWSSIRQSCATIPGYAAAQREHEKFEADITSSQPVSSCSEVTTLSSPL